MKVAIMTVGDEILIGQIIDTNSAWMAEELNQNGAEIVQITSVGDDKNSIIQAIRESLQRAEVVLMTGGLGPTRDDITKTAIAAYLGVGMYFDQPTYDRILKLFERWGRSSTPEHREQCYMPQSAELLHNKMGTAPGMWFKTNGKVLVSMPGVPYEMKYLMKERILPKLRATFPEKPLAHRTVLTVGEGESRIANRLKTFEEELPDYIKLAFLPSLGQVRLRLTAKGLFGESSS
jgi:nicotinamide-nucleotide amidase